MCVCNTEVEYLTEFHHDSTSSWQEMIPMVFQIPQMLPQEDREMVFPEKERKMYPHIRDRELSAVKMRLADRQGMWQSLRPLEDFNYAGACRISTIKTTCSVRNITLWEMNLCILLLLIFKALQLCIVVLYISTVIIQLCYFLKSTSVLVHDLYIL